VELLVAVRFDRISLPNVFVGTDFTGSSPWAFAVQLVRKISTTFWGQRSESMRNDWLLENQYRLDGEKVVKGYLRIANFKSISLYL